MIRGIIYAGGETELKNSVQILGSIISNEFKDSEITNAVHIVHDETYIPSTSPPGLTESGEPEARVLSYKELPYFLQYLLWFLFFKPFLELFFV